MFDNRLNFLVASVVIFMIHLQSLFKRLIDFKTIGIANRNCFAHIFNLGVSYTQSLFLFFNNFTGKIQGFCLIWDIDYKNPSYNNF